MHTTHQYVVGAVHTQTIEGFWSIFKRSIVGSYHKVSAKYMPLSIAECQFKYNNRDNANIFGVVIQDAEAQKLATASGSWDIRQKTINPA